MANLVIASVCNLSCPYCFAEDYYHALKTSSGSAFTSLEVFKEQLDFLERSGIHEVRLIGGEPSLHPHFSEIIRQAHRRAKNILIFTNGLIPDEALLTLESLSPEECTVLVNTNTTIELGSNEKVRQRRSDIIHRLGQRILLGYNIYRLDFDLNPLLDLIQAADCRKVIRLGLAHPTLSGQNVFLHPKHYPFVGQKIAEFADDAAKKGIVVEFDCGFVRCMFTNESMDLLIRAGVNPGWHCNAILDINLDKTVFHCFPLAKYAQVTMMANSNAADLRTQLSAQVQTYRSAGIYKECSSCSLKREGECTGGCLASTMRRFQRADFSIRLPGKRKVK